MTRNFTLTSKVEILLRSAVCQAKGCDTPLCEGVEWDHIIPWSISKDRSAKNCQALCPACHAKKTNVVSHGGKSDKTTAAKCTRVHKKHTGEIKPKGNIQNQGFQKGAGGKLQGRKFKSDWKPNTKQLHEPLPERGGADVSE